jgi:hypothetical protein
MTGRLPRRIRLGPYVVDVVLVTQCVLKDVLDDEEEGNTYEGAWVGSFDPGHTGAIYIDRALPRAKQWGVFFHELLHAVNDIRDWDADPDKQRSAVVKGRRGTR